MLKEQPTALKWWLQTQVCDEEGNWIGVQEKSFIHRGIISTKNSACHVACIQQIFVQWNNELNLSGIFRIWRNGWEGRELKGVRMEEVFLKWGAHESEIKNSLITAQARAVARQFLLLVFISRAHSTLHGSRGVKEIHIKVKLWK